MRRTPVLFGFALLLAPGAALLAHEPSISQADHYTENRGWNEAGLGPTHQVIVNVTVIPSGFPTLVFAESGSQREPLTHFPQPGSPHRYALWLRYEPGAVKSWRVLAERNEAKSVPVQIPTLERPQRLPLAAEVRVIGKGTQPRVAWKFPDLKPFDVDRIRVGVRGGQRVHGRFLEQIYVSGDLPSTATSFAVPERVLAEGERYIFQVMLEDLQGGALKNRSLSFSDPFTPSAAKRRPGG